MAGRESLGIKSQRDKGIVFEALTTHAPALLRTARRHSLCADDAHDAYQRALEILLRRAGSLDSDRAINWLHTVVKHEAMAVRRARQELVSGAEIDLDREEASTSESPEERAISWEHTTQAAEAFKRLKPQERKALWLKATGLSYAEIADRESWTYTKVNRCLAEGRKSFLERYAGIESGAECERWAPLLSALVDGEASAAEVAEVRPHLRNCASCRATVRQLHESGPSITVLVPVGLVGASGGAPSSVSSAIGRLWETASSMLGERATATALKMQMAGETLGAGKIAVVAASAAAVAGGGAVVAEQSPSEAAQTVRPPFSRTTIQRSVSDTVVKVHRKVDDGQARGRVPEFGSSGPAATAPQVADEFGPEQAGSPSASGQSGTPNTKSSSVSNGTEFDP